MVIGEYKKNAVSKSTTPPGNSLCALLAAGLAVALLAVFSTSAVDGYAASSNTSPIPAQPSAHAQINVKIQSKLQELRWISLSHNNASNTARFAAELPKLRSLANELTQAQDPRLVQLHDTLIKDIDQMNLLIKVAASNPNSSTEAFVSLSRKKLTRMIEANEQLIATLELDDKDPLLPPQQLGSVAQSGVWIPAFLGLIALLAIPMTLLLRSKRKPPRSTAASDPLKSVIEGLPDGCVVLDENREIKAHNSSAAELLPSPAPSLEGIDAANLYAQICLDNTQTHADLNHWLENLHADCTSSIELMDHRNRHLLIRERPTKSGEITTIIRDITDVKEARHKLQQATDFDTLTGLPNRALYLRKLRGYSRSSEKTIALINIDIRDFRQVNDSFGQNVGDQLLIGVANCLQSVMPEDAFIARVSGDEFSVMIHPLDDRAKVEQSVSTILDQLRRGIHAGREIIPVHASVGIAYGPEHGVSPIELKNSADSACSQAKKSINNSFCTFSREWQQNAERVRAIEMGLLAAIENNELRLAYQPQLELATNTIAGMEALVRWDSAKLGKISPTEFIPAAEKSGLIIDLGIWVLKNAINDFLQLKAYDFAPGSLAVNLSRKQFDSPDLIRHITEILEHTQMPHHQLTLEITETAILDDRVRAEHTLKQLHALGVNLSIDDFGVGYSSFLELRDFPISEVKIDRSFIHDVVDCDNSQKIIQAIVNVAEAIGAEVVAEGIESQAQFDAIRQLGCHRAQGFFLCEPKNIKAFPKHALHLAETESGENTMSI